jgi:hypothetical protein
MDARDCWYIDITLSLVDTPPLLRTLSVLTVWSMLWGAWDDPALAGPCMLLLLLLLRLLLLRPVSMWLHMAEATDALLLVCPAPMQDAMGPGEGIKAGICGLSGELVLLLFLFFVSDTCINPGDGFPPTETASRGVSAGDCIAVPAALLLSDSPAACCCCS